jgi:hypothetical protein
VNNLINELNAPIIEYNDKGEQIQRAPTSLMIRASKALKQMLDINQANNIVVQQNQAHVSHLFEQLNLKDIEINQLKKEVNEAIYNAKQETSVLGTPEQLNIFGSDSDSKDGGQTEGCGTGTC